MLLMTSHWVCMWQVQHKVDVLKKDTRGDIQQSERYGLTHTPSALRFNMQRIIRSYCCPMHRRVGTGVECLESHKLFCHTRPWNTSYHLPNKITHNTICLWRGKADWGKRGGTVSVKKRRDEQGVQKWTVKKFWDVRKTKIKENRHGET